MKVGIAQIDSACADIKANVQIHKKWIHQARENSLDLLVFPELSLTGYSVGAAALDLAISASSEILIDLAECAKDINVMIGFIEEGDAALIYNSVALIRDGKVLYIHRKINLPTYGDLEEGKLFARGNQVGSIDLQDKWRMTSLICADMWDPSLVHQACVSGATLLIAPISSALGVVADEFDNPGGWETVSSFYSMIYGLPVLIANRCGREGDLTFWGGSRILGPYKNTLAIAGDTECLLMAQLDFGHVRNARFRLPTVRDCISNIRTSNSWVNEGPNSRSVT